MEPRAKCNGCGTGVELRLVHPAVMPGGVFKFWHRPRGKLRCGEVIIDRFPVLPPHAPPRYPTRPPVRCSLRQRLEDYERQLIEWGLTYLTPLTSPRE